MHRLFVYGTLQHPPVLRLLLGRVPALEPATLGDHRAAPVRGRPYPGLVRERGSAAPGHLLEVDDDELAVLDRFEGAQYARVEVTVGGRPAWAWLLADQVARRHAGEGHWDLETFVASHAEGFLGGSTRGEEHPHEIE